VKYNGMEIVSDGSLDSSEKETSINFDRRTVSEDGTMDISSFDRIVVEHLLQSPNFIIKKLHYSYVEDDICIVGVDGKLPLGHLRIKQDCKTPNNVSFTLSKQF